MSLFCLVHGSTQDASGWDLLVPELERRGHETVRMNLPADEPDASASRYADVIAESIPSNREDAIVVAHSASGLFLPLVPERRAVRRLVFLAAAVPQVGVSFQELVMADNSIFNREWLGKDPTRDDELALRFLFHDLLRRSGQLGAGHPEADVREARNSGDLPSPYMAGSSFLLYPVHRRPGDSAGILAKSGAGAAGR